MAEYIVNEVGSPIMSFPSKILTGDTLVFNTTNDEERYKYEGTMLTYTFPFDCEVILEAAGARGGKGNQCTDDQVGKGAVLKGTFTFSTGDTLLMCIGQAGTDFQGSYSDGTSGAGGGGTFITKKTTGERGDIYNGSGVGNGWRVDPLIISAGGSGGRDVGYSGAGTVLHGLATTEDYRGISIQCGGGYSTSYSDTVVSGRSFLEGGQGATGNYTRQSTSYAGFGGGGENSDDGYGGAGGGWYGGTVTKPACSYISNEAKDVVRLSGQNFGEGYFKITFLTSPRTVSARCKINGRVKQVKSMKIKTNGTWKEVLELKSKINGVWK